jgi:hypothetical protein
LWTPYSITPYIGIYSSPRHLFDTVNKRSWSLIIPPGLRHLYIQTDTRSRSRQYIGRAKDWVEWALGKPRCARQQ